MYVCGILTQLKNYVHWANIFLSWDKSVSKQKSWLQFSGLKFFLSQSFCQYFSCDKHFFHGKISSKPKIRFGWNLQHENN